MYYLFNATEIKNPSIESKNDGRHALNTVDWSWHVSEDSMWFGCMKSQLTRINYHHPFVVIKTKHSFFLFFCCF